MTADYPTDEAPATAEYVLAVINAAIRSFRPGKDQQPLTLDTTIAEWCRQTDWFIRFVPFAYSQWYADFLDGLFDSVLPETTAIRLTRKNTLRDLCRAIADRMGTRRAIRPWRPLVGESRAAGAFLTLKSILARTGTDVSSLSPSTPLNDPTVGKALLGVNLDLIRLTPETCPVLEIGGRRRDSVFVLATFAAGFMLCMGAMGAAIAEMGRALILSLFACGSVIAVGACFLASRSPMWPLIPGMRTYRDLAYALAGQHPRPHPFSSAAQESRGGLEPGTQA